MRSSKTADVCFVLPGIARVPVGGYRVVYEYANMLAARGHAVTIAHMRMSHMREPGYREYAARARYAVTRRQRPTWFALDERVEVNNLFDPTPTRLPAARTLIATSVGTAPIVAARVDREATRGVYLIQGLEDFTVPLTEVELTWRLELKRIVVSRWLEFELNARGLSSHLIENGVDRSLFRPPCESERQPHGVLAMISEHPLKRSDLVLDVYERLAASHPEIPLRTFGACSRPDALPARVEHAREPSREHLAHLYRQSNVYICASDQEGFGLPALEAMSSGCAVVTTDNGGVPAFGGEAVLTVPRGDAERLWQATATLLDDPSERLRLSAAGIDRARELDAEGACDRLESLIFDTEAGCDV